MLGSGGGRDESVWSIYGITSFIPLPDGDSTRKGSCGGTDQRNKEVQSSQEGMKPQVFIND